LRILSTKSLKYNWKPRAYENTNRLERSLTYLGLSLNVIKKEELRSVNLVIHVHGGGFFAQSTESHLGYLIK
jgi:phage replication-related protein YjqB (UPF0714/DUF867 family)